jgi:outer membrane biogenesis lipoprotein LolB
MNMNKKYLLVAGLIILVLVAGCTSTKAQKQNVNFNVVWSEIYDDASSNSYSGYRVLSKIDIPDDKRECYITRYIESVAMVCYDKQ